MASTFNDYILDTVHTEQPSLLAKDDKKRVSLLVVPHKGWLFIRLYDFESDGSPKGKRDLKLGKGVKGWFTYTEMKPKDLSIYLTDAVKRYNYHKQNNP